MKIAFLADPLESFKTYKDSTYAMMTAAARRGHALYHFKAMSYEAGQICANVDEIELVKGESWYKYKDHLPRIDLSTFDAVLVRRDPPFDMRYVTDTWLLELAQAQGARIFNDPAAIRAHNEKLSIAQFPKLTTPTLVSSDLALLREFHRKHQDIIIKPLDGMGGTGIFRISTDGMNLGAALETLTQLGTTPIMAQRYIPEIVAGDKRILLINGTVVPYSLARMPLAGEVRANMAVGGKGVAKPLSARDLEIANTLGPVLAQRGLFLVGLDVIGEWLTEINVTSPTGFQEISSQTGFDVGERFIEELEANLAKSTVRS